MITWVLPKLAIAAIDDLLPPTSLMVIPMSGIRFLDARMFFLGYEKDGKFIQSPVNIGAAKDIINDNIFTGRKVVVFCRAGLDRSPFIVAKFLVGVSNYSKVIKGIFEYTGKKDLTLSEAYGMIKELRPAIVEHWEWE